MSNIVAYFNTFFDLIFGQGTFSLYTPVACIIKFESFLSPALASSSPFEYVLTSVLCDVRLIFSMVVWSWFSILIINLLLVFPYNWIRSVIRKCRAS